MKQVKKAYQVTQSQYEKINNKHSKARVLYVIDTGDLLVARRTERSPLNYTIINYYQALDRFLEPSDRISTSIEEAMSNTVRYRMQVDFIKDTETVIEIPMEPGKPSLISDNEFNHLMKKKKQVTLYKTETEFYVQIIESKGNYFK